MKALLNAPVEVVEYIQRLADEGITVTGVENDRLAITFTSAPYELVAEMTDLSED